MAEANVNTVLGNFNQQTFKNPKDGVTTKFFMKGKKYFVNTRGPDGTLADYEILYTFGVEPLQQYLIQFPNGRLQCLAVAWNNVKKEWYHIFSNLNIDHKEWLHWSRGGANWNSMCADCHSTNLKKNYDPKTKKYATTFSEINVGCRSCHGESEEHVKWAMQKKTRSTNTITDLGLLSKDIQTILERKATSSELIDTCARCHSRRSQITEEYKLGDAFMDHYLPELMQKNTYHGDGQILDEVYVYGSFLQSKMYHKGVSCTHCHDAHSTKTKFEGNMLCTQCHSKKDYDTHQHHHHREKSKGAMCIECHMPGKHYMGIDFRRDHSFRIPRPDQSIKYGTPNACNQCHDDKSANWAKRSIEQWFGKKRKPHYSDLSLKVTQQKAFSKKELIQFILNKEQPSFIRASMLSYLNLTSPKDDDTLSTFSKCLNDSDKLMRYGATLAMEQWPSELRKKLISPLLKDPLRALRIQAVSLLVDVNRNSFSKLMHENYSKAEKEYLTNLKVNSDFPSGMMNLGNHYLKLASAETIKSNSGNKKLSQKQLRERTQTYEQKAIDAFLETLKIDNQFSAARMNLSRLYNLYGKNQEAKAMLEKVVEQEPNFWGAWYNYGLLLNELKEYKKSNTALEKAAKLCEGNPNVFYNWAISCQSLGLKRNTEKAYSEGLRHTPNDIRLLNGYIIFFLQHSDHRRAKEYSERLIRILPNNENFQKRHAWIRNQSR